MEIKVIIGGKVKIIWQFTFKNVVLKYKPNHIALENTYQLFLDFMQIFLFVVLNLEIKKIKKCFFENVKLLYTYTYTY